MSLSIATIGNWLPTDGKVIAAGLHLTIIVVLLCSGTAYADCAFESPSDVIVDESPEAPAWRLLHDRDGICTWNRNAESSRVKEVAVAAVINASPEAIADLIVDCPRYPAVFDYVDACEVVQEHTDGSWVFQQLNFPGPISDRYYTIDLVSEALPDGVFEVSWTLVTPEDAGREGRGIATVENIGRWHLRPDAPGESTRALYYLYIDPGGVLPKWIVNLANRRALPNVIRDVRNELD